MATDIFDRGFSDHVVFDRIVDVDRTITLARQAADAAEKKGQHEKAEKLREKADYLEEILNNTQNPDYSDEDEGTPPANSSEGNGNGKSKASGQGEKSNTDKGDSGEGEEEKEEKDSEESKGSGGGNEGGEEEKEESGEDSGSGGEKQPEDISDLDSHNGKHASGTNQHQGGGPSGNGAGGGGGGSQGSGSNNPQNQGQGQGKGQGQNQELDPFRVSSSKQPGNQKQPTKEEILAAIIKKLSGLSGEAKKGADRALQDYFNNVSGGGTL